MGRLSGEERVRRCCKGCKSPLNVSAKLVLVQRNARVLFLQIFTNKLKYIEDYKLMDGRLIICAVAVGAAMFALVWDFMYPFPLSK